MYSKITTGAVRGIDSYLIRVETDVSDGLPALNMVGYLSTEVREAGERVRVALKNIGVKLPPRRITVNLAPADVPKRGIVPDLPVCVGVLICMGILPPDCARGVLIAGELGLKGDILPVRGVMSIVREARRNSFHTCIVPEENCAEGAVFDDIKVVGVSSLSQLTAYLSVPEEDRDKVIRPAVTDVEGMLRSAGSFSGRDFSAVHGHREAKRVLEIAAAGRHNVLLKGPPGTGKSMLAACLPGIMPPLTVSECLEITNIYSVAGKLSPERQLILERPFLSPHHTSTRASLTGGGRIPGPGVLSLAHLGVLYMDELPEFGREQIDLLRQPLEEHEIRIARQGGTFRFPARVLLIGAMNECPCGYFPDLGRCRCTPWQISQYQGRLSGPFMDRIDLQAVVGRVDVTELQKSAEERQEESSRSIRGRVIAASQRQAERFAGTGICANGDMGPEMTEEVCRLDSEGASFMRILYDKFALTARGYHRILRTARTIADLADQDDIAAEHLQEAARYRMRAAGDWNTPSKMHRYNYSSGKKQ